MDASRPASSDVKILTYGLHHGLSTASPAQHPGDLLHRGRQEEGAFPSGSAKDGILGALHGAPTREPR